MRFNNNNNIARVAFVDAREAIRRETATLDTAENLILFACMHWYTRYQGGMATTEIHPPVPSRMGFK